MRRFCLLLVVLGAACDSGGVIPAAPDDAAPDPGDTVADISDEVPGSDVEEAGDPVSDLPEVLPDLTDPGDVAPGDDEGPGGDAVAQDPGERDPDAGDADAGEVEWPPRALPFAFTRSDEGEPLAPDEVSEFTRRVTGLWKRSDYFRWLLRTSHGVDPSTGKPDFLNWWNDVLAIKSGDLVTFRQVGGDHNMWIASSKVLAQAIGGYLLTGDWVMGKVVEQYCKGLTATMKGMVYDENDPLPYLMSRNTMAMDHAFTLDDVTWRDDGRKKAVEYSSQYYPYVEWNTQRFEYKNNPFWGDVWVTNMRSKDDVCHIVRTTTWLPYVAADAPDDFVREACAETYEYMKGFNKDIVDQGYYIRTKDPEGHAYIIPDQDLGSYVWYVGIDERNECTARLASDLIAYGRRLTNDCGTGTGSIYDTVAVITHYYNYAIIRNYHMAALGNALVSRDDADALALLEGLAQRADSYTHPSPDEPGVSHPNWSSDVAEFLVQSASLGLPLTSLEARLVHTHWLKAVEAYEQFPRWDLWDPEVPDGEYPPNGGFRPSRAPDGVDIESVALFLEYCFSPFRNPAGVAPVDCEVVRDPARWGE